jgi:hypothetical protein
MKRTATIWTPQQRPVRMTIPPRNDAIPVVLCIDVEPDPRDVPVPCHDPWRGFEAVHDLIESLRDRIARATGAPAHFSWMLRMDPQVQLAYGHAGWVAEHYRDDLCSSIAAGDEIGLHPHTYRWTDGGWLIDTEDPAWVLHSVRMSFETYMEHFGRGCSTIRMGDRWMNDLALAEIERLGAKFDLTVEPGALPERDWSTETPCLGELPDYSACPRRPYRPSVATFRDEGFVDSRAMWMIPLSSWTPELGWRGWADEIRRRSPWGPSPPSRERVLYPEGLWWRTFLHLARGVVRRLEQPYLALAMRSSIGLDINELDNLRESLGRLADGRLGRPVQFCTPAEALTLLSHVH